MLFSSYKFFSFSFIKRDGAKVILRQPRIVGEKIRERKTNSVFFRVKIYAEANLLNKNSGQDILEKNYDVVVL